MRICEYEPDGLVGKSFDCACGLTHTSTIKGIEISDGAINKLFDTVKLTGAKSAFIAADENTYKAAGALAVSLLEAHGVKCVVKLLKAEEI